MFRNGVGVVDTVSCYAPDSESREYAMPSLPELSAWECVSLILGDGERVEGLAVQDENVYVTADHEDRGIVRRFKVPDQAFRPCHQIVPQIPKVVAADLCTPLFLGGKEIAYHHAGGLSLHNGEIWIPISNTPTPRAFSYLLVVDAESLKRTEWWQLNCSLQCVGLNDDIVISYGKWKDNPAMAYDESFCRWDKQLFQRPSKNDGTEVVKSESEYCSVTNSEWGLQDIKLKGKQLVASAENGAASAIRVYNLADVNGCKWAQKFTYIDTDARFEVFSRVENKVVTFSPMSGGMDFDAASKTLYLLPQFPDFTLLFRIKDIDILK
jgi:hypothetical protein